MNAALPSIVIRHLGKTFRGPDGKVFPAIDDISLEIGRGMLTAIVGPDGAGKTTLMRTIAGLLRPDSGSIEVLGTDVTVDPQSIQDRVSYMPQRFGLYEDLSVQENLDLYADLHGVPQEVRSERFSRLLTMTDLERFTSRPAGKLSGGMKQKLGLACTLVRIPELLLLDEPSVGVDPLSRRDLWVIIEQLMETEGLSVVVSTAYMDEAQRCDAVFVLNRGRLLASGTPEELTADAHGLTYVATPLAGMSARDLQAQLIDAPEVIVDAVPSGGQVNFIRMPGCDEARLRDLLADCPVEPRKEQLEDAFMLLLHRHDAEEGERSAPLTLDSRDVVARADGGDDDPVIAVRDVVRRFGDFVAVANTTFEVRRGEIFGLLGPNGAGKTTTFRMLCGLLPASGGELRVAGVDLRTARAAARARIGYVAQKFSLYSNLSVEENLDFFGGVYGLRARERRTRVRDAVGQFGLDPSAQSGNLPLGYKQRLAMAAGLLHRPEILFLDEPTSGIDPLARRAFWRTITALARAGVTVVVTTHFMEEAEYCDRIAIQDAGRILALGTPHEVRRQSGVGTGHMNEAFIAIIEKARSVDSQVREIA